MPNINITHRRAVDFISPRHSTGSLFEIGLLIILIVLGYIYLVSPKQKETNDRISRLATLTDDKKKIDNQKKVFEKLVKEMNDNKSQVAAIDEAIPLEPEISKLYVLTEYLAQSAGMNASSVTIENNPAVPVAGDKELTENVFGVDRKLVPVTISVNAIGTMDQLTGFLSKVETSNRLIDIISINITPGKGDQFIFKFGLQAYSFAPNTTAAGVRAPISPTTP